MITLGLGLSLIACEEAEDRDIASAQSCLNNSSDSGGLEVKECLSKIDDYNSVAANRLKCAVMYRSQGFSITQLQQAFDALDGTANPMQALVGGLTFKNIDPSNSTDSTKSAAALEEVREAKEYCSKSGSIGLTMLVVFSYTGTKIVSLASGGTLTSIINSLENGTPISQSDIQAAAANLSNSADEQELGEVALLISNSYCNTPSANKDVCTEFETATGGSSNPQTVGANLGNYLD